MRYEFTDYEWAAIKAMLPNKPRGIPHVNDRRVLNGIFWVAVECAMTSSQQAISHSYNWHPSGCGCALMSPRPKSPGLFAVTWKPYS
jgi:transposase